jgi:hypothetical protein
MQPGVADGLADDDPIAGPIRRRPVERDFGTVQPPELVLRLAGEGVQFDALGVGERLDAGNDSTSEQDGAEGHMLSPRWNMVLIRAESASALWVIS